MIFGTFWDSLLMIYSCLRENSQAIGKDTIYPYASCWSCQRILLQALKRTTYPPMSGMPHKCSAPFGLPFAAGEGA